MVVKAMKLKIHNRGSCGELVDHSYGNSNIATFVYGYSFM